MSSQPRITRDLQKLMPETMRLPPTAKSTCRADMMRDDAPIAFAHDPREDAAAAASSSCTCATVGPNTLIWTSEGFNDRCATSLPVFTSLREPSGCTRASGAMAGDVVVPDCGDVVVPSAMVGPLAPACEPPACVLIVSFFFGLRRLPRRLNWLGVSAVFCNDCVAAPTTMPSSCCTPVSCVR